LNKLFRLEIEGNSKDWGEKADDNEGAKVLEDLKQFGLEVERKDNEGTTKKDDSILLPNEIIWNEVKGIAKEDPSKLLSW
jgi:hypothetical protein